MIDCKVKFGSYVPTVPQIYKDCAEDDDDNCDSNVEQEVNNHLKYLKKANSGCDSDDECCNIGSRWTALTLLSVEPYNDDTSTFEFALRDSDAYLSLPVCAHLLVRAPNNNDNDNVNNNKNHDDSDVKYHIRPYTAIDEGTRGKFKIMVKRYREWGVPESKLKKQRVFLYCKTDHSYKPPGKVSNYIHSLRVGQTLDFKYNPMLCHHGKIRYPFETDITNITMIAVGVGVIPMIRILRAVLEDDETKTITTATTGIKCNVKNIVLLYGVRTVKDILQRKQLDEWHDDKKHQHRFKVCYCIGSRWNNIIFGALTDNKKQGPPLPEGWDEIKPDRKELGWVDGDKVSRRAASTAQDDKHRVFISGLPGIFLALVGPRSDPKVEQGTQLHELGYRDHQVIKF